MDSNKFDVSPPGTPSTQSGTVERAFSSSSKTSSDVSSSNMISPSRGSPNENASVDLMEFNERPTNEVLIPEDELAQEADPFNLQMSAELLFGQLVENRAEESLKVPTKDEAVTATTPTMDHMVQTSRKPTLNYECKYGYHFPSSPTSSMISELAKEVQKSAQAIAAQKPRQLGYGKSKLTIPSSEEEQLKRLVEMFPTATSPVIERIVRVYQGREGLIKAALISLGYKRVTDYSDRPTMTQSPVMLMMAKPASKKLFEKLVSYFPDKDESLIKELMYKHKEVEHEIISELVESGTGGDSPIGGRDAGSKTTRTDKNEVIMKLRYLKYLFPTCDETELYHLLHLNDLKAQVVIEMVEKRGHKRANIDEVIKNRMSQSQQMRAQQQAMAAKDKVPSVDPVEAHKNRTKPVVTQAQANNLKENLKKSFDAIPDGLILKALENADYNEALAKRFLDEAGPIDETLYKQRYEFHRDIEPDVVRYPCKGTQKNSSSFMTVTADDYVSIPREIVESDNAIALLKVDACTFTQDDFEKVKFTYRRGKKDDIAKGSIYKNLAIQESLRRGAMSCLRLGSNYQQICHDAKRPETNKKAIGHNPKLAQGRQLTLACGHNEKLIQHTHPFYQIPGPRDNFYKYG